MHVKQAMIEQRLGLRCHFGGGSPTPPAVPKPPSPTDAAANVNASNSSNRARADYGSTILTTGTGVPDQKSNKKTLLGA